jgi:hypothetical protein
MKLIIDARLPFPRETVFAAYRDDITKVLEFLPNVRRIDPVWRKQDETAVHLVHEWRGGGELPATVRGIFDHRMLGWHDLSVWDHGSYVCDWKVESNSFPEGVRCRARTCFLEEGATETLLHIRGMVEVDARHLPGVPAFLARSVARSLEEFVAAKIEANLRESIRWFEKYKAALARPHAAPSVAVGDAGVHLPGVSG